MGRNKKVPVVEEVTDMFKDIDDSMLLMDEVNQLETLPMEDLTVVEEPRYNSIEWPDFVLSKLHSDELDPQGFPLLAGLRRLTEDLLGEITFSGPIEIDYSLEGGYHASCIYEIRILWKRDTEAYVRENDFYSPPLKIFRAAADSFEGNTDSPWDRYATTIAESRAEARAYRKALGLKVVSKEEVSDKVTRDMKFGNGITPTQLSLIKIKIKALGLREDFSKHVVGKDLNKCTSEDGAKLIRKINEYQGNIDAIPEEVKA